MSPVPTALLIAYDYPPAAAVGAQRTLRFTRYLKDFGWRAVVLTPRVQDYAGALEPEPRKQVPAHVVTHTARVLRPLDLGQGLRQRWRRRRKARPRAATPGANGSLTSGRHSWARRMIEPWFTTPDAHVGWLPAAAWTGYRLAREHDARVLYTTGPPHSAHLVGLTLKRLAKRPWVADFRDPWTRRPWLDEAVRRTRRHQVQVRLEALVVRNADKVILNTDRMRHEFASFYGDADKFVAISNGFDPEAFPPSAGVEGAQESVWTLAHAGSLYRKRDPGPLLHAIARLREQGIVSRSSFRLHLVGSIAGEFDVPGLIDRLALGDLVQLTPSLSHSDCLQVLARAQALLIIQPGTDLQVPSKLFEYIYLGRAILALAPPGATADIVLEHNLGIVADPESETGIADGLSRMLREWKSFQADAPARARYDGRVLTGELARVFAGLAGDP